MNEWTYSLKLKDLRENETRKFTMLSIANYFEKKCFGWTRTTVGGGAKCCGYLNKHNSKICLTLFSN